MLRDLLSPATLTEKTFGELCATLKAHFQPKPIVIAERFRFHQRSQGLNESVAEYIAELRKLALHCEFGEFLKDALRDRLVCGLRNAGVQKQLLAQTDLTLDKALQVAQGMEAAEKSTKALQGGDTSSSNSQINRTGPSRGSSRQPSKSCYRCGHTDHIATACRFRESTCNRCHKKGHLAKVCQSGQRNHDQQQTYLPRPSRNTTGRGRCPRGTANRKAFTIREPESGDELPVLRVGGKSVRPIMVEITINGKKTQMHGA